MEEKKRTGIIHYMVLGVHYIYIKQANKSKGSLEVL